MRKWNKFWLFTDRAGVVVALSFSVWWAGYGFDWWPKPETPRTDVMVALWYFTARYFMYSAAETKNKLTLPSTHSQTD